MTSQTGFTETLRQWRKQRKVSQLELALAADVSQRHISWLETGRSQPSREMVIRLSEALDIPLRDRNYFLNTAGFADLYSHSRLEEPSMAPVLSILETILKNHEPYPAYVMDRHWNIKLQNDAASIMFEVAGDAEKIWNDIGDNGEQNIALLTVHPNGLRNYIQNWDEMILPFVKRIKKEALESNDAELIERVKKLQQYVGGIESNTPQTNEPLLPVLPIKFGTQDFTLNLYSIISTFGTAQDITANELRIECFYPADLQTEKFFTE